ncbi:putative PRP38 pre-mRNA splicing factor family member [Cryptosporidium canis]|uniref:Pre-mRNA-splicing factor 38 n=1 Tax=Cryptosporidium canis TaxID=195482 RepID=A0ABQ8P371_9CRYT|nr:putative PRP38 pre-mRNA splicing factor family member [Cryptosporidium canis]KAJ1614272.1 putative PRP38 pre-mRNA splicing factor family member [Cryptosporidium canis]
MRNERKSHHKLFSISSILRDRVFSSIYWKGECFALDSVTILDKAVLLDHIGTTYGGDRKATPFLCLLVKLLQINPSTDIVLEYINNERFIYLTALGIVYLRLTESSVVIHKSIEHLYQDYRRIRIRNLDGSFGIIYLDELVEICLCERKFLDLDLPYIQKRSILVKQGHLKFPRESKLEYNPSKSEAPTMVSRSEDSSSRKRRKSLSRSPPVTSEDENNNPTDGEETKDHKYSSGNEISLSVEKWNAYRKKLGLKPLIQ